MEFIFGIISGTVLGIALVARVLSKDWEVDFDNLFFVFFMKAIFGIEI